MSPAKPTAASRSEAVKALIDVQAAIANPLRTGSVEIEPGVEHRYPELDQLLAAVRPLLSQHDLLLNTHPVMSEGHSELGYRVEFVHSSGGTITFEPMFFPAGTTVWERGAAWTYAGRYALMNALNLAGEDTDAQEMPRPPRRQQTTPASDKKISNGETSAILRLAKDTIGTEELETITQQLFGKSKVKELTKNQGIALKAKLEDLIADRKKS